MHFNDLGSCIPDGLGFLSLFAYMWCLPFFEKASFQNIELGLNFFLEGIKFEFCFCMLPCKISVSYAWQ